MMNPMVANGDGITIGNTLFIVIGVDGIHLTRLLNSKTSHDLVMIDFHILELFQLSSLYQFSICVFAKS